MKRGKDQLALAIARREWKKEKREKTIGYLFLYISIIAGLLVLILVGARYLELTGHAASIDSSGGYVTEVDIKAKLPVSTWGGIYGLALSVTNFTQQLSEDLESGTIERSDVFFDCIQTDAEGGPEIYASTSSTINLETDTILPATTSMLDDLINCTGQVYCADNTFTNNMSIVLGSNNITGIPSTFTYKFNGDNEVFNVGALNVSGNLVFVSHINSSIQSGFASEVLVNYQMLLPTPVNTTQTYYFYADPNDECPSGGVGTTINATLHGFVEDSGGSAVENATITVAGYSTLSNSTGYFNLSFLVVSGTYSVIGQKSGYDPYISNLSINFSHFYVQQNITLPDETPGAGLSLTPTVYGFVTDTSGNALSEVNISLGANSTESNSTGNYSFSPLVVVGTNPIIAIKQDYDNYIAYLNFTIGTSEVSHNISMVPANDNSFPTGPFPEEGDDTESRTQTAKAEAEELGQDFWISTNEIKKQVRKNTFVEETISFYNFKSSNIQFLFTLPSDLADFIELDKDALTVSPGTVEELTLTIYGTRPIGTYTGDLGISGDVVQDLPIEIEIVDSKLPIETLLMEIALFDNLVAPGGKMKYQLDLQNLLTEQSYKIELDTAIVDSEGVEVLDNIEEVEIQNSLSLVREIELPDEFLEGDYSLVITGRYFNLFSRVTAPFVVAQPFYLYSFFGIRVWMLLVGLSFLSFVALNFLLYRRHMLKKKRYHIYLNLDTLPKPGPRAIKVGRVAEKKVPAYLNLDAFTTHGIVAGATGGGKSIAAQVIIEEALMKNIAVVVFDPTAQWSGMLRKCEDKKMLSFYPKFGLKPSDARAFPGNVRQITNFRQSIDIGKYIRPGQIQIFTLNKLDPSQMDIFVAGVIANIFRSDPKEHRELKTIIVFDEVHRLLPKFGGSGKGFLQIERACREFRKWGLGVLLVSQVLSDFVGEIKANINTEVQMRVAEENDLERIRERYGLDALKSLVRADVGVGMVQNAEYNRGKPYFVNLRPILHNTRRLSDEVLEKYNKYGEKIEDLEYQVEQLEKEKVDTFDLKMELKLVKDKLMTGNFTVVDIYLEGLEPRLTKQWEKIGKHPKKREIELIAEEEVEASIKEAQAERKEWEDENKKEEPKKEEKKVDNKAKLVKPLTFENGMMISSLKEFQDVLPGLDQEVFTKQFSDIVKWASAEFGEGFGKAIKSAKDKDGVLKVIDSYGKEKKEGGDEKAKENAGDKEKAVNKEESDKKENETSEASSQESEKGSGSKTAEKKASDEKAVKKEKANPEKIAKVSGKASKTSLSKREGKQPSRKV